MYNDFYDPYRSNAGDRNEYLEQLHYAHQLLEQEIKEDLTEYQLMRQSNTVAQILQIFLTRRQDVLQQIEAYGVLRPISMEATRIIIQYVLNNANQIPGNMQQKEERLFRQFTNTDMIVVPILRIFRVPENVINQYVREVIRVTLRNMGTGPQPGPEPPPEPDPVVRRILRELEAQHPNFFGLTSRFNIPQNAARNITSDIIDFTLRNINRIPQTGNLQTRADAMLRLLDAQNPQLIERMIRRGVPAGEAEAIARQIILFALRNIGTQPEPGTNVNRILREFEVQHPNYLGLTTTYRIPADAARTIVRDIIEFTVTNLNRIPQVGTLQQRADAMLRLIDSMNPQLIERMIRRGVPAVQAESITRQIILFTLQRVALPR